MIPRRLLAFVAGSGTLVAAACGGASSDRTPKVANLLPATTTAAETASVRSPWLARVVLLCALVVELAQMELQQSGDFQKSFRAFFWSFA